jgi:hypothetical protein
MNFLKIFLLIFLLTHNNLFAEVKVLEWQEDIKLTNYGRFTKHIIKIKAENLNPNTALGSFSITSSEKRNLEILNLRVNAIASKHIANPDSLQIYFSNPLKNNQTAYIEYDSKDYYKNINEYLRQEIIYVPEFAKDAYATINFDLTENYNLISSHDIFKIDNNKIIFKGKIGNNGIQEVLKLTNSEASWKVLIQSKIAMKDYNGSIDVISPYLFRGGAQNVSNQTISFNQIPKKHLTTRDNDEINFEIKNNSEIIIQNKANIKTGKNYNFIENIKSINSYLSYSKEEEIMLRPILEKILNDPKYFNMPLHAKLVDFVHNYLKYDISYYKKLLTIPQILQVKSGVCIEFASLFNSLARVAKIPSSIVYGYALGEYDKFESHAWNMIYVDNKWIYVDPTWNLSSGLVTTSHIYIKDNRKEEILIKYKGTEKIIEIERDFRIEPNKNIN